MCSLDLVNLSVNRGARVGYILLLKSRGSIMNFVAID